MIFDAALEIYSALTVKEPMLGIFHIYFNLGFYGSKISDSKSMLVNATKQTDLNTLSI